jgi:hypothetical protein
MRCASVGRCGILAASLCALLSSCMPIPYPIPPLGYTSDCRDNLSGAVQAFIIQGQTSREEVLYKLGEPDGVYGADDTFEYLSVNARGGVGILVLNEFSNNMPVSNAQRILFRRLLVQFDISGRVSSAASEAKTCSIGSYSRDLLTERDAPVSVESSWKCANSPVNRTP